MKYVSKTYVFLTIGIAIILVSCNALKYVPDGERLYTGASVEIQPDSIIPNESQLKDVLEQALIPEPNSSFLGMRPGLYFYYKNQKEHPGFINRWLYKKLGEEPVYQSDVQLYEVEDLLVNRLENRGFFYSTASSDFVEEEKTADAIYKVKVTKPYKMKTFQLDSIEEPLKTRIGELVEETNFKPGMRFDLDALKLERDRIDNGLKRKGYYNFNQNFLLFEADTNRYKNKRFDLYLRLKKDVPKSALIPYRITEINIYPNYDITTDSIPKDTIRFNGKNYLRNELFFKEHRLDPFITLAEGQLYDPGESRSTSRRLSTLGSYKYVNIQHNEIDSLSNDSIGYLKTDIYLSPLNKRAVRAELQAVSKSNNFAGPRLAITFVNRNLFKGGELLSVSAHTGYEFQMSKGNQNGFRNIEVGLNTELLFPRMLSPIKIENEFFQYSIPKTKATLGLNYLSRTGLYQLVNANTSFGYSWNANRFITYDYSPISVVITKLSNTTAEFEDILEANPFLQQSFEQEFIPGTLLGFTYNGMVDQNKTHQIYFSANFETAGNLTGLIGKEDEVSSNKTVFGMEYAQFAKLDVDLHYHYNFGNNQTLASRLFAGYGLAYGNSEVIPFIKQYVSGGPYSVRAFRLRSLGPGTFQEPEDNSTFFDQIGNIRFEANVEYRFPLFSFLNGAVFADAGNVWLSKENATVPGGKFTGKFLSELGMGAGVGLRVDIQGFVLRFDFAAPFHDPGLQEG
ncbi:translocation and assembly module lipoprotein TamL, partial [Aegicerativicinus sediminis]